MRHLLSIADVSKLETISILDTAHELARVSDGDVNMFPNIVPSEGNDNTGRELSVEEYLTVEPKFVMLFSKPLLS